MAKEAAVRKPTAEERNDPSKALDHDHVERRDRDDRPGVHSLQPPEFRKGDPDKLMEALKKIVTDDEQDEANPVPAQDQVAELLNEMDADTVGQMRDGFKTWMNTMKAKFNERSQIAYNGIVAQVTRAGGKY
jgi:hypothetical protein